VGHALSAPPLGGAPTCRGVRAAQRASAVRGDGVEGARGAQGLAHAGGAWLAQC